MYKFDIRNQYRYRKISIDNVIIGKPLYRQVLRSMSQTCLDMVNDHQKIINPDLYINHYYLPLILNAKEPYKLRPYL